MSCLFSSTFIITTVTFTAERTLLLRGNGHIVGTLRTYRCGCSHEITVFKLFFFILALVLFFMIRA